MAELEKIVFENFGPYRFIGKAVYARAGSANSGEIFGSLWGLSAPIFEALDALPDYATAETDAVALLTWDKYDDEKKLLGYTVGRFMKPDTPVPEGLDFFDLPAMTAAKGYIRGHFDDVIDNAPILTIEAIKANGYELNMELEAEVYTPDTVPDDGVVSVLGYYFGCKKAE